MPSTKKSPTPVEFKVGDAVTWTSSAGGGTKTKDGTIVAVIPAGKVAGDWLRKNKFDRSKYAVSSFGWSRNHESYIVSVEQGGKAKPKLYHPVAALLKPSKRKP